MTEVKQEELKKKEEKMIKSFQATRRFVVTNVFIAKESDAAIYPLADQRQANLMTYVYGCDATACYIFPKDISTFNYPDELETKLVGDPTLNVKTPPHWHVADIDMNDVPSELFQVVAQTQMPEINPIAINKMVKDKQLPKTGIMNDIRAMGEYPAGWRSTTLSRDFQKMTQTPSVSQTSTASTSSKASETGESSNALVIAANAISTMSTAIAVPTRTTDRVSRDERNLDQQEYMALATTLTGAGSASRSRSLGIQEKLDKLTPTERANAEAIVRRIAHRAGDLGKLNSYKANARGEGTKGGSKLDDDIIMTKQLRTYLCMGDTEQFNWTALAIVFEPVLKIQNENVLRSIQGNGPHNDNYYEMQSTFVLVGIPPKDALMFYLLNLNRIRKAMLKVPFTPSALPEALLLQTPTVKAIFPNNFCGCPRVLAVEMAVKGTQTVGADYKALARAANAFVGEIAITMKFGTAYNLGASRRDALPSIDIPDKDKRDHAVRANFDKAIQRAADYYRRILDPSGGPRDIRSLSRMQKGTNESIATRSGADIEKLFKEIMSKE